MEARIKVLFGVLTLKRLQLEFSGKTGERLPICELNGGPVACRIFRSEETLRVRPADTPEKKGKFRD